MNYIDFFKSFTGKDITHETWWDCWKEYLRYRRDGLSKKSIDDNPIEYLNEYWKIYGRDHPKAKELGFPVHVRPMNHA